MIGYPHQIKKIVDEPHSLEIQKKKKFKKNLGMSWRHKIHTDTDIFLQSTKMSDI